MPTLARVKYPGAVYHVTCRSIPEVQLFRDNDDKSYYINLIKRFTDECLCAVYSYCIMDNHLHLYIDPRNFDISTFMLKLNVAYVRYYNKKYNRHGHLFQGRFLSKIVSSNEYALTLSAYIHNNPKDIEGYNGKEELYPYSSYGIYLDLRKDVLKLVDKSFIRSLFNVDNDSLFVKKYHDFVKQYKNAGYVNKKDEELSLTEKYEYRSGAAKILRDKTPSQVISYISERLPNTNENMKMLKSKRETMKFRAFCAYTLKVLCGLTYREICENLYNITISTSARLCNIGYELANKDEVCASIFNELITAKL